jgi:hypothetical protein
MDLCLATEGINGEEYVFYVIAALKEEKTQPANKSY